MTTSPAAPRSGRVPRFLTDLAGFVSEIQELGAPFAAWRVSRLRGKRLHHCHLKGVGPIALRTGDTDPKVFLQVFRDRQYDLAAYPQNDWVTGRYRRILDSGGTPLIVDLGANNGASALWFAAAFPAAAVVSVEPDPAAAQLCRTNTRGRNITVVEAAIGSDHGTVTLIDPGDCSWGISTRREPGGTVPVVTVTDLHALAGDGAVPFLIKVDIEGFESDLFAANLGWLDDVTVVMVEPHDWLFAGRGTSAAMQRVLGERGFEMLLSGENIIYVRRP